MAFTLLQPAQLRRVCDPHQFNFESTADLEAQETIIGQPRGVRAIEFGIGIQSPGYNIYVLGDSDTGRTATLERFLLARAAHQPVPPDWVYVHNFTISHQPRALSLPAGQGGQFKGDMQSLIESLKKDLSEAFDTDAYREASENIRAHYKGERNTLLEDLRQRAIKDEMTVVDTPSGWVVVPMSEGKAMSADVYQQLPVEEHQMLERKRQRWGEELDELLRKMRELDEKAQEQTDTLDKEVAASSIKHYFDHLREKYAAQEAIWPYLEGVYKDVLDNLDDFAPPEGEEKDNETDLRRYEVNLLVDNGRRDDKHPSAPVVVELNPRYTNLLGRIEYEMQFGATSTHFTNIKAGSLHRANGGYLILNVRDILAERDTWEALKRAIRGREIKVQPPDRADGNQVLAKSLDPEPIPLQVKIILLGNADYYYTLYNREEDFSQLFKVKAEFDMVMPRTAENELAYATFVASRCQEEQLRHFEPTAVAQLVEFGSRLSGYQNKLSTRMEIVADVVREASYWAGHNGRERVTAADVQIALDERRTRSNLDEAYVMEHITDGSLAIRVRGTAVGQANGLSIIDLGDYTYGQPGRISARTFRGEQGIINIDREVELTGPIHHKGLLALVGFLGGNYAQEQALTVAASITFEQNYGLIEGDSASTAELCALLSSLANLPLKQSIAVTGAVNQHGDILPIGGVTEKIEGFFHVCQIEGLTGEQGVVIPHTNIAHLMLEQEVVTAVQAGQFHIWAVRKLDEAIEVLSGVPAGERDADGIYPEGSFHAAVQEGLKRLSKQDEDEEEGEEVDSE